MSWGNDFQIQEAPQGGAAVMAGFSLAGWYPSALIKHILTAMRAQLAEVANRMFGNWKLGSATL